MLLEQLHIRRSHLGYSLGKSEWVQRGVLERLPEEARSIFPSNNGLLVKPPPDGNRLPEYTFMAELYSSEPVKPEYDCSNLA